LLSELLIRTNFLLFRHQLIKQISSVSTIFTCYHEKFGEVCQHLSPQSQFIFSSGMIVFSFLLLLAVLPASLAFSCPPCPEQEGCQTIRKGAAEWDEANQEWEVLGEF
jgi:hypothetical protein